MDCHAKGDLLLKMLRDLEQRHGPSIALSFDGAAWDGSMSKRLLNSIERCSYAAVFNSDDFDLAYSDDLGRVCMRDRTGSLLLILDGKRRSGDSNTSQGNGFINLTLQAMAIRVGFGFTDIGQLHAAPLGYRGEFHVHRAGDFLGDWEEADPPSITSGKWEYPDGILDVGVEDFRMVEEGNGRVVQFYAETTGFRRQAGQRGRNQFVAKNVSTCIGEEEQMLQRVEGNPDKGPAMETIGSFFGFTVLGVIIGKVYGEILSGGSAANVAIRENLFLFGVAAGIFLACLASIFTHRFILGPVSLLALVFFSLREDLPQPIVIPGPVAQGSVQWITRERPVRHAPDPDTVPLAPATLKALASAAADLLLPSLAIPCLSG
ncbi:hypothetical protein AK812_SmicGene798 [Symbiodinium microadriaticum]|uniref:Uncharacterized protein n=1 Tax=Symbiodinium microadriaticum TaxID=2951 RepID=A0A1Q9F5X8_SYMMI|nr:hypothetical protein AK812_SmicGene798 [Symbiodinium microadriaticum]